MATPRCTLKQYFELNKSNIDEDNFKNILKNLIKEIEQKHSQKLVIDNISLDSISIEFQNDQQIIKFSNFKVTENDNDYLNDIINVGLLLISIFVDNCDINNILNENKQLSCNNQKLNHIRAYLVVPMWIQHQNIENFIDLIVKCLNVEHQNYKLIETFKDHKYLKDVNYCCTSKKRPIDSSACTNIQSNPTFRQFLKHKKDNFDENELKYIIKVLLNEVQIQHGYQSVLDILTLDNVIIITENNRPTPKLLNISTNNNNPTENDYLKNIQDVGTLVLSIFTNPDHLLDTQNHITYEQKFDCILQALDTPKYIKKSNLKLFADLIVCMLNVQQPASPNEFKSHPYFWTDDEISKFIDKINSRLNLSTDGGSKDEKRKQLIEVRKAVLEAKLPKDYKWKSMLGDKISCFYPNDSSWTELIKFIRNKDTHKDDCTDSESEYVENYEPITSKTNAKASRDPEALKQVSKFFNSKNGPISFFIDQLDDLLYLLFNHFRLYADHKIMKKFYFKSFVFENPKEAFERIVEELKVDEKRKLKFQSIPLQPKVPTSNIYSTNRPPDVSAKFRNDVYRTNSVRAANTANATKKYLKPRK
ncbi:uncharacterized protein [Chironomus tepperi]|uniref:uncharacterized protein n=1 Tax=Chironomus tepperi TaxID=113505 RepID=UPI00391F327D